MNVIRLPGDSLTPVPFRAEAAPQRLQIVDPNDSRQFATVPGEWQVPPNPSAGLIELNWFDENLSRLGDYAGLWIAIKGKRIVASSDDAEELLNWIVDNAIVDALVVDVPEDPVHTPVIA